MLGGGTFCCRLAEERSDVVQGDLTDAGHAQQVIEGMVGACGFSLLNDSIGQCRANSRQL
jgi:hypothetical protein